MTEIDIWIKVFEHLDFKFIDEFHSHRLNTNYLRYEMVTNGKTQFIMTFLIYFNLETGEVNNLTHYNSDSLLVNKQTFYNRYKEIFRQIKLETIV